MNKGLIQSHLNRATAKNDTVNIEKWTKAMSAFDNAVTKPKIEPPIVTAIKRLNAISKQKKVAASFLFYNDKMYTAQTLLALETIEIDQCKFYKRNANGTTEQVYF